MFYLFEGYSSTIHQNASDFPKDSPTNQTITVSCILILLNGSYFWVRQSSYSKTILRKPAEGDDNPAQNNKGCHHFSLYVYIGFLFVFHFIAGPELDAGASAHSPSTWQEEGVGKEEGHKRGREEGENLDIIYRWAKLTSKQPDTELLSLLGNTEEHDIKE